VKVLLDTNIVLDLLLEREPFIEGAIAIFEEIEQGNIQAYITATTITNIFYIIRKNKSREVALIAVKRLMVGLQLCPVNVQVIEVALDINLRDFEDSVQLACATVNQLTAIITRDAKDFIDSPLPIYTPTECLYQVRSNQLNE
jgi:predicted nucleic acid-binding protein